VCPLAVVRRPLQPTEGRQELDRDGPNGDQLHCRRIVERRPRLRAVNYPEDEEAVVRVHQQLREFDGIAALDSEPERSGWGYGFSFRDPEANVWGVAVKYGSDFDDRGGFIYP
jgi:hypothetical protein